MKILVLNSGSSSQKSCLYEIGKTLPEHPPVPAWEGKIEWDGNHADIQAQNLQGAQLNDRVSVASRSDAIDQLLDTLWNGKVRAVSAPSEIDVVGHRIVHGGKDLVTATAITPEVKSAIARMSVFAPLHNRSEEHTSELQSHSDLVCRLLLEKKKKKKKQRLHKTLTKQDNTIYRI